MPLTVLVCGASGFIGRRVAARLAERGHRVLHGVRDPARWRPPADAAHATAVQVDFTVPREPAHWLSVLRGVDVVVNAVGLFRETPSQRFADVHARSPCALFEACGRVGVRRVIQVSALGADEAADTAFHLSKRVADDCLLALPIQGVVLMPSLVFGAEGASTALLGTLATLPVVPLPAGGMQRIQPVHVDDLVGAVMVLVETTRELPSRVPVVGPRAMPLRAYLGILRGGLGLGGTVHFSVPQGWMAWLARRGNARSSSLLDEESWRMLQRGNTDSPAPLAAVLGRPPRPAEAFLSPMSEGERTGLRHQLVSVWAMPLWRVSLAVLWLVSGWVSLGLYPVQDSLAMLRAVGVPAEMSPYALYGAALLDILFGVWTVWRPGRRLWTAQIALILLYTAFITIGLPELWLHPFGPITKNVPLLAMLVTLRAIEPRP